MHRRRHGHCDDHRAGVVLLSRARCTAEPGPSRVGKTPGLQRTTSCCVAPGGTGRQMPKIDIAKAQVRTGSAYPEQFKKPVEGREKTVLGDLAGLTQFGVNRTLLKPGAASSLRHWHE